MVWPPLLSRNLHPTSSTLATKLVADWAYSVVFNKLRCNQSIPFINQATKIKRWDGDREKRRTPCWSWICTWWKKRNCMYRTSIKEAGKMHKRIPGRKTRTYSLSSLRPSRKTLITPQLPMSAGTLTTTSSIATISATSLWSHERNIKDSYREWTLYPKELLLTPRCIEKLTSLKEKAVCQAIRLEQAELVTIWARACRDAYKNLTYSKRKMERPCSELAFILWLGAVRLQEDGSSWERGLACLAALSATSPWYCTSPISISLSERYGASSEGDWTEVVAESLHLYKLRY